MSPTTGPRSASIPVATSGREADGAPPATRARRADAERNRRRLLDAAARLIADHGLAELTMDGLAEAAAVGKGTVYRAFGDRSGVAQALVDDGERALQEALLRGPPPLGPGAPPAERVAAFADAFLRMVVPRVELFVEVDHRIPGRRFTVGSYAFWRAHLAAEGRRDGQRRPELTAELVLGLLAADLQRHLAAPGAVDAPATVRRDTVAAASAVFAGAARRPARPRG